MKKTIKFFGLLAGVAPLLLSCQKEELVDNSSSTEMVEYSVVADYDPETKTAMYKDEESGKYLYKWSEGEKLGVVEFYFVNGKTSVDFQESNEGEAETDDNGVNIMKFSVGFRNKNAESYMYYSVYPSTAYQSASVNGDTDKITLNVELPEVQTPLADTFDPSADILVSKPFIGKPNDGGFLFELKRQSVGVKMNVRNFAATDKDGKKIIYTETDEHDGLKRERIEKITITSANSTISGKTAYVFEKGKVPGLTQTKYGISNNIILDYSSFVDTDGNIGLVIDNNGNNNIYFTTWPFSASDTNPLSIEVQTTNYIFTKTLNFNGRTLPFNKSNITSFNVSFNSDDVDIVEKEVSEPILGASYYVVARDNLAMIAKPDGQYIAAKTIVAEMDEDASDTQVQLSYNAETGKYDIADVEPLPAVWKFEYSSVSGKYLISSVSEPDKYLKNSGDQSLTLVSRDKATYFSVEREGEEGSYSYTIIASGRYMGCVSKFSLLFAKNDNTKLKLTEANISSTFKVQDTFEIPVGGGESFEIPVSLFNINPATVTVSSDVNWITNCKFAKGVISFTANEGNEDEGREAIITLTGTPSDGGDVVTKDVKVIQHHSVYYATLSYNELADALTNKKWGTVDKYYAYTQSNGAEWGLGCDATYDGKMSMTVNSGYVKLPTFGTDRSIRRVTVNLSNIPYANRYIGLYSSVDSKDAIATVDITEADKAAGKKTYVISVEADGITTAYIKTNTSIAIVGIEVDARKPLAAPTGLKVDGKTLSWNPVADAAAYDVTVGSKTVSGIEGASYTFDGADEWYDVTVVAKADDDSIIYIDSNPSETANLKFGTPKLNKPELAEAGAKQHTLKVTWTGDNRADAYVCTISPEGTIKEQGDGVVEFEGLEAEKEYTVTVYATSAKYAESDPSTIKVTTAAIELDGDGSVGSSYTAKDVNALSGNHTLNLTGKYVEGIVTERALNEGQMTYTIESGGETWKVTGKDLGNAAFSYEADLPVGAEVKVYYIDNTNNYLYSIGGRTSILTGIEVGAESKVNYEYNKAFAEPVVYASYRGAAKKVVTGTVSDKPAKVTASKTLIVTYTEDGVNVPVTVSTTYEIKVVKFTHRTYNADERNAASGYVITAEDGGISSVWKNFVLYTDSNAVVQSFRARPVTPCTADISAINEDINTVTLGDASIGANGKTGKLTVKKDGTVVKTIDFTLMKGLVIIDLGGTYSNCTYHFEFDCSDYGGNRLDISYIIFENK